MINIDTLSRSARTIELIRQAIEDYIGDDRVVVEGYREEANILETRENIPVARIGIYESTDSVTDQIGNYRPVQSEVGINFDITVYRGYEHNGANYSEYVLLNLQDAIIDWSKEFKPNEITENSIYSLGYVGSGSIVRFARYATRTLNFTAIKEYSHKLTIN